jgi:hypothetical protein
MSELINEEDNLNEDIEEFNNIEVKLNKWWFLWNVYTNWL